MEINKKISEEEALVKLLTDQVLFSNGRKVSKVICPLTGNVEEWGSMTFLCVSCNDLFMWGCSDAEDLPYDEILNLYNYHVDPNNKNWGSDKWCCIKRNEQPQAPIKKQMIEMGVWDDIMEKLPLNNYDDKF